MATTRTKTYTFTRINAVKLQFTHALLYCSDLDKEYIDLLLEFVEKRQIESFTFYGLNNKNKCEVEFTINIDWNKFKLEIQSDENIQLSSRTAKDGISQIIRDWTDVYLELIEKRGLNLNLAFRFSDEVKNNSQLENKISQVLNCSTANIKYANNFKTVENFKIYELPEMDGEIGFS
jgi:hypothetical protein